MKEWLSLQLPSLIVKSKRCRQWIGFSHQKLTGGVSNDTGLRFSLFARPKRRGFPDEVSGKQSMNTRAWESRRRQAIHKHKDLGEQDLNTRTWESRT
jgi:hypothetical protein